MKEELQQYKNIYRKKMQTKNKLLEKHAAAKIDGDAHFDWNELSTPTISSI